MTLLLMPSLTSQTRRIGSALLIVLAMLLLISALVMAFFTAVTTERTVARSFSDSGAVRNLANTALQLAMAQVADATAGGTAASPLAWASQPGMIRTYDTNGAPYRYYKLYSATAMTVTNAATFSITDDVPPSGWQSSPGMWTDLNAPVAASGGTLNYPIVDPAATNTPVQGFSITNPPGYSGGTASATNNPAPMPVRWLYQLKNGTLVPAPDSGGTIAGASTSNPIVGRIAFWTDDETCKVNINTAAEGTYWDTPRLRNATDPWGVVASGVANQSQALSYPDYAFAAYPPARFEFQRYPGHPAQVALSTVFPNITSSNAAGLTPKFAWGGSLAGTTRAASDINLSAAPRKALYASVDEFQFSGATNVPPRTDNNPGNTLTKADLEAAKFFITSASRAPEVNLFNLPRIASWPVDKSLAANPSSTRTTAYDRLIAFCSTLRSDLGASAYRYYFQRGDSQSATNDYAGIQRNQDLYAYLQRLTGSAVPGFGGNFLDKYPLDRDQILTEIFDYIRCINLVDPNLAGYPVTTAAVAGGANWPRTTNQFSTAVRMPGSAAYNLLGLGQVLPIQIGATRGFGRIGSIKEVGLVIACVADGSVPPTTSVTNSDSLIYFCTGTNSTSTNSPPILLTENQFVALVSNMKTNSILGVPTNALGIPNASTYLQTNSEAWNYILTGQNTNPANGWFATTNTNSWLAQIKNNTNYFAKVTGTNVATYYNPTLGGTSLTPTQKRLQVMIVPVLLNAGAGMINYGPDLIIGIEGLGNFTISNAQNIMGNGTIFPATNYPDASGYLLKVINNGSGRPYNNPLGTADLICPSQRVSTNFASPWKIKCPVPPSYATVAYPYYPFVSLPFTIDASTSSTLTFPSTTITMSVYQGKNAYDNNAKDLSGNLTLSGNFKEINAPTLTSAVVNTNNFYQTATITFPPAPLPLPALPTALAYTNNSSYTPWQVEDRFFSGNNGSGVILDNDVVRSMCFNGDARLAALMTNIPATNFTTYPNYSSSTLSTPHQIATSGMTYYRIGGNGSSTYSGPVPFGTSATTGDFDMAAKLSPSPFINKPDEGDMQTVSLPYYVWAPDTSNPILYTPNRIMPSPGMFGSLPTGVKAGAGWKTLLFRPQTTHPSYSTTIPDHLIMDLFWMPIVEPYAISEPFSTAGKINMNYQILPFTYINRSTAVQSAMKIELVAAVPNGTGGGSQGYPSDPGSANYLTSTNWANSTGYRKTLNLSETDGSLRQFKAKFASGDIFRSASQICDIYLTPRDQAWASDSAAQTFWSANLNTADNLREKPYANLYARLTTKSNTYTVHVRAQVLQKVPGTPADQWVEGRDRVAAEERASTLIERYVDVEDTTLPDFATDANARLSDYYRMRILSTKRFAP